MPAANHPRPIRPVSSTELARTRPVGDALAKTLEALAQDAEREEISRATARQLLSAIYTALIPRDLLTEVAALGTEEVDHVVSRMANLGVGREATQGYLRVFFRGYRRKERPKRSLLAGRRALILDDDDHGVDEHEPVYGYGGWEHIASLRDLHPDPLTSRTARAILIYSATERLSLRCFNVIHGYAFRDASALVRQGRDAILSPDALRELVERTARA